MVENSKYSSKLIINVKKLEKMTLDRKLEKSFELNSTGREAVIAVETRYHAKNNGVSPKSQTSRVPFLSYFFVAVLAVSVAFVACDKININVLVGNTYISEGGKYTVEFFNSTKCVWYQDGYSFDGTYEKIDSLSLKK